jgi:hypothetical protein
VFQAEMMEARRDMMGSWAEILAEAQRAAEAEDQRQLAEEKRWHAGQALAAAVMEAAEAEQGRFAAERSRQSVEVVCVCARACVCVCVCVL